MYESITKNVEEINNTCIKITFNSDITEDMGNELPYPHKHYVNNQIWTYYWYINGFFGTRKGLDFLNDIKARFLITYPTEIDKIRHFPTEEQTNLHLKQFQGLKSKAINIINKTSRYDNKSDFIFWCLKLEAERLIKENDQVRYDWLLDFGLVNFGSTSTKQCKDTSTLKSKCRSIVNYYIDKNFELDEYQRKTKTKEEWIMTRTENMKLQNQKLKEKYQNKIKHFITGLYAPNFKFKSGKNIGKWNVSKMSKELSISRPTLIKHLTEMGEL
ncbi:MAG: hypothetical protein U9N04_01480 [Patescibacteria group bacterium]|nr:hypothetical protein [Patescibacteria group bacterium]